MYILQSSFLIPFFSSQHYSSEGERAKSQAFSSCKINSIEETGELLCLLEINVLCSLKLAFTAFLHWNRRHLEVTHDLPPGSKEIYPLLELS